MPLRRICARVLEQNNVPVLCSTCATSMRNGFSVPVSAWSMPTISSRVTCRIASPGPWLTRFSG